jgi:hypothetical protein
MRAPYGGGASTPPRLRVLLGCRSFVTATITST